MALFVYFHSLFVAFVHLFVVVLINTLVFFVDSTYALLAALLCFPDWGFDVMTWLSRIQLIHVVVNK